MTGERNSSDELEAGLQRLFSDDRLSIRPSPAASQAIVAGARRARRRREVALIGGGSAAVALVLVAVVMLAALPRGGDVASVAAPHPTSVLSPGQQPTMLPQPSMNPPGPDAFPEQKGAALGPDGYGKLRLGMSFRDLRDNGLLANAKAAPPKGCVGYSLAEGEHNIREIIVSEERGLVILTANQARTPEGIGLGSTNQEVLSAYPGIPAESGGDKYDVKAGEVAYYRLPIADDGSVGTLMLVSVKNDCGSP